ASKVAAIRYLEGLRVELRGSGVSVTTICPGYVATPMTERNPYRMPFILDADDAARRFARVIAARKRYCMVPWQMAIAGRVMQWLPMRFTTVWRCGPDASRARTVSSLFQDAGGCRRPSRLPPAPRPA